MGVSISPSRRLQLVDHPGRLGLGLDDGELAELDPGAGHHRAAPGVRPWPTARSPRPRRPGSRPRSGATSRTRIFCIGVVRSRYDPCASARSARSISCWPPVRPAMGASPTKKLPSFCRLTPTWSPGAVRGDRGRAVDQLALQVLVLQHLAELLRAPVGDQELDPGPGAQPAVAVVAEDAARRPPRPRRPPRSAPRRRAAAASIGLVDRPPPTHRSKPGPCSGCSTPTNATSLISGDHVLQRVTGDGGLELARQVRVLRIADVAVDDVARWPSVGSMISSAAMPATGEPRMTRGQSPQASVVDSPTASRRRQISGTSSIRIQCSCTFCRSVMSAVSRAKSTRDLADHPQLLAGQRAAVDADPEHEVLVVQLLRLEGGGLAAVDAGLALGVQPVPAEAAAQVTRIDARRSRAGRRCSRSGPGR